MTAKLSQGELPVVSAIETVLGDEDIFRLYPMSEEGRIGDNEFVTRVTQRVLTTVGSMHISNEGATAGGILAGLVSSIFGGVFDNLMSGSALTNDVVLSILRNYSTKRVPCDNKATELELEIELD